MVIRATSNDPWTTGCTGTLISPTVFLTAGHCTVIWEGLEWGVSFDPVLGAHSKVITDGTWHRHPDFIFPDVVPGFDAADMAVFVMKSPVRGIRPAKLPKLGFAARYASGEHCDGDEGPRVTTVGYGVTSLDDFLNGAATAGTRRRAAGRLVTFDPFWIMVAADPGTACVLDSGGPTFVGGADGTGERTILSTLTDGDCQTSTTSYRLDTPHARAFLRNFVRLP